MQIQDFLESLKEDSAPFSLNTYMLSIWYDLKTDWHKAHEIIQDLPGRDAALIHAYLHRKEGDMWNADYWYKRAGRSRPSNTLEKEQQELIEYFIHRM